MFVKFNVAVVVQRSKVDTRWLCQNETSENDKNTTAVL